MEAYCRERQLKSAVPTPSGTSVELPAAVLERKLVIDSSQTSLPTESSRDVACEIAVPMSVLEELGKDVYAGHAVCLTCDTCPGIKHVARVIPVDVLKSPPISADTANLLDLDVDTCRLGGKAAALLSPMMAFNLGIQYHMAPLMQQDEVKKLAKRTTVKLTTISSAAGWPDERQGVKLASPPVPGCSKPLLHTATHVALAHCSKPEKMPPFSVVDYQQDMQEAARQMSGQPPQKDEDELEEDEQQGDALTRQRHEQHDADVMKVGTACCAYSSACGNTMHSATCTQAGRQPGRQPGRQASHCRRCCSVGAVHMRVSALGPCAFVVNPGVPWACLLNETCCGCAAGARVVHGRLALCVLR